MNYCFCVYGNDLMVNKEAADGDKSGFDVHCLLRGAVCFWLGSVAD